MHIRARSRPAMLGGCPLVGAAGGPRGRVLACAAAENPMEPFTEMSSSESSKPSLLRTVFRVLTLRGDGAAGLSGNAWLIVVLSAFAVALWIAFDWLRGAPDPEFYPY